jgi:hypothetical protein
MISTVDNLTKFPYLMKRSQDFSPRSGCKVSGIALGYGVERRTGKDGKEVDA